MSLPTCPTKTIPLDLAARYAGAKRRSAELSQKHNAARDEAMRVQAANPHYKASDGYWRNANEIKRSLDDEIKVMNAAADEILSLAEIEGAGANASG